MNKYIPAEKLIAKIERRKYEVFPTDDGKVRVCSTPDQIQSGWLNALKWVCETIISLQQEQPVNMIQWTGSNIKEVIDFTGKSPMFGEWFKSWDDFENYVNSHGRILKLFCEDGSHYEVPVGAWIVKTPDGYNVPSVARFIHAKQEQPEVDIEKEIDEHAINMPHGEFTHASECEEHEEWAKREFRHFYELGLNARKEE